MDNYLKENFGDGNDEKEVQEDSPVRPYSSDVEDEKFSDEKTSPRKDDSDPLFLTSDEDKEFDDADDVGNALSDNISEFLHSVSPNGSSGLRITSWQRGNLLGSGSYGTVYKGMSNDGFSFAIKEVALLDPGSQGEKSLLQLQQEISLLSQFDHENVVQCLGSYKDEKKLSAFLELMTEGSLENFYHNYKLIDSHVSEFTRQILNGVKYLHDRKVAHRDIKCANILIDAKGSVKLADFGLAKVTETNANTILAGSPFWMAPEVVNPKLRSSQPNGSYGLKVDIWSLGCTVLEMFTRRHPYPKLERWQAIYRIGKGSRPPVPSYLSSNARNFILACLQKHPEDRPTAAELLDHPFVRKPPATSGFASPLFNDNSHNFLPGSHHPAATASPSPPSCDDFSSLEICSTSTLQSSTGSTGSFPNGAQEDIDQIDVDDVRNIPSASNLQRGYSVSPQGSFKQNIVEWRKCRMLGVGSFARVYEVITNDGSFFAVKELYFSGQECVLLRLEQEIKLHIQLEHENIVRYIGTDKDNEKLYIFLELMSKGSLVTLCRNYALGESQLSAYTRQILNGLKYLHDKKVIHRDVKCANILVDASGSVKLADFGLAKATEMSAAKTIVGTPQYMAPEILNAGRKGAYGLAADIWSLGCTVLEMFTGQTPYPPLEEMHVLFRICRGELTPIPDSLSRDARDFILNCLQVNPNDRPTAAQLLDHPFVKKPPIRFR